MKKLNGFLRPHWVICLLLSLICAAALVWVFLEGYTDVWFCYPIYVLSAYALTVDCVILIPLSIRLVRRMKTASASLDQTQRAKKFRFSLWGKLAVNLGFGLYNLILGIWLDSLWMYSMGLYYMVQMGIQLLLVRYERRLNRTEPELREKLGWKCFRLCGVLLLLLNLTMTGIVVQTITEAHGKVYPGHMVFAVAAYTFGKLISAIVRVVKCRGNRAPISGAARNVSLTGALMSILHLQTAMFAAFGGEFTQQTLMNALTGIAVCLMTVLGAVGMIAHGNHRMREIDHMNGE